MVQVLIPEGESIDFWCRGFGSPDEVYEFQLPGVHLAVDKYFAGG